MCHWCAMEFAEGMGIHCRVCKISSSPGACSNAYATIFGFPYKAICPVVDSLRVLLLVHKFVEQTLNIDLHMIHNNKHCFVILELLRDQHNYQEHNTHVA